MSDVIDNPTPDKTPDAEKPWWKSWTKWGVIASLFLGVPSIFAAVAWGINAIENRGFVLAGKQQTQQQLTDLADSGKVHTTEIAQSKQDITDIKGTLKVVIVSLKQHDSKLTDIDAKIDKVIWFLLDARKPLAQASGPPLATNSATQPSPLDLENDP